MISQSTMQIMIFVMHFLALCRRRSPIWSLGSPFSKVARLECGGRALKGRRHRFSRHPTAIQTIMKSLVRILTGLLIITTIYIGSYFLLMNEGITFNTKTFLPEFATYNRFVDSERVPGDLSIYFNPTHWTNHLYAPLDRAFRPSKVTELEIRREKAIKTLTKQ